ncbi:MAG: TonB-dependent receptor [Holophagales bacterium]|nr:TonB-dependent receptor [Holophagales bacterium]MYG30158.1 TonB-dependent receptor [Holophagales bacterium]MYI81100.1 TonB-dependent receptor [Holophagales bacterium]
MQYKDNPLNPFQLFPALLLAVLATTAGLDAEDNTASLQRASEGEQAGAVDSNADGEPQDETTVTDRITVYGKAVNPASTTGSRLQLTVMETPATVDIIDGDTIRERLDTSVMEAVTRSAGFTNDGHPGNGSQNIAARGFRGQGTVTKMFDGTNYYNAFNTLTFPFDTWGVERIEVLKGPASVLYGEGGIGGAYNVIPKRPQQDPSGDLRVSVGENDTRFLGLGLTGGLTNNVAYRLDYSNNQSDNWVDRGDSKTEMISASLLWQVTDDFSLTGRYDHGDQEPMRYFGTPLVDGAFPTELIESNFDVTDGRVRYEDGVARLRADWNISERLSMQSELYRLTSDRFWKTLDYFQYDRPSATVNRSSPLVIAHDIEHDGFRTNFVLDTGNDRRQVKTSAGFEINDLTFARATNFGGANPNGVDWNNDFDVVNAFDFNPGAFSDITDAQDRTEIISDVAQLAVFAESQIGLTRSLTLVLGLRHEDVETDYEDVSNPPIFDQNVDALTGRAGLTLDLRDDTVLYGQYTTGATHPSNSIVQTTARNREVDFIRSEQVEVGIKQQLLDRRLSWSAALFDIVKNNLIEDDPSSLNPEDVIVIPEQTSQGVEFSLTAALADAVTLTATGVLLDAETDTGETPREVPEETFNLGLVWAPLGKLQFSADARYVGERAHPDNPIPSYTVVDASARWRFNEDLSVAMRVDNVFDELYAVSAYYWPNTWLVGKPRTVSLTLDYDFF